MIERERERDYISRSSQLSLLLVDTGFDSLRFIVPIVEHHRKSAGVGNTDRENRLRRYLYYKYDEGSRSEQVSALVLALCNCDREI